MAVNCSSAKWPADLAAGALEKQTFGGKWICRKSTGPNPQGKIFSLKSAETPVKGLQCKSDGIHTFVGRKTFRAPCEIV